MSCELKSGPVAETKLSEAAALHSKITEELRAENARLRASLRSSRDEHRPPLGSSRPSMCLSKEALQTPPLLKSTASRSGSNSPPTSRVNPPPEFSLPVTSPPFSATMTPEGTLTPVQVLHTSASQPALTPARLQAPSSVSVPSKAPQLHATATVPVFRPDSVRSFGRSTSPPLRNGPHFRFSPVPGSLRSPSGAPFCPMPNQAAAPSSGRMFAAIPSGSARVASVSPSPTPAEFHVASVRMATPSRGAKLASSRRQTSPFAEAQVRYVVQSKRICTSPARMPTGNGVPSQQSRE